MAGGISASGPWMFFHFLGRDQNCSCCEGGRAGSSRSFWKNPLHPKSPELWLLGSKAPTTMSVLGRLTCQSDPSQALAVLCIHHVSIMPYDPLRFSRRPLFFVFLYFDWFCPIFCSPVRAVVPLSPGVSAVKLSSDHWSCSHH